VTLIREQITAFFGIWALKLVLAISSIQVYNENTKSNKCLFLKDQRDCQGIEICAGTPDGQNGLQGDFPFLVEYKMA
jgi:hypothetical protein